MTKSSFPPLVQRVLYSGMGRLELWKDKSIFCVLPGRVGNVHGIVVARLWQVPGAQQKQEKPGFWLVHVSGGIVVDGVSP